MALFQSVGAGVFLIFIDLNSTVWKDQFIPSDTMEYHLVKVP